MIACGKGRSSNVRGGQIVQNHGACDACGLWYSRYRRRAARLPPLLPSCWSLAAGSGGVGHATWAFSARTRLCVRSNALMIRLKRRSGGSGGLSSTHDPAAPVPTAIRPLDSEHSWVGTQKACLEGRTPETLGLTYYHCAWTAGAPAEAVGRPGGPDGRRRAIGRLRHSPVARKGLTGVSQTKKTRFHLPSARTNFGAIVGR